MLPAVLQCLACAGGLGPQNISLKVLFIIVAGETFGTEDPRTGEIYTQVAEAQEADVDAAVKAARMVHTHSVLCLNFKVHLLHNPSRIHGASLAHTEARLSFDYILFPLKPTVSLITQCPVDVLLHTSWTASSLKISTFHLAAGKCHSEQLDKHVVQLLIVVTRQSGCILFKCYTR